MKQITCLVDRRGEVVDRSRFRTTPVGVAKFLGGLGAGRAIIEVGPHSPWLSRALREAGHEVIVANPRQVALIAKSDRKNDKRDAETLARLGRVDPRLLCPVTHRSASAQADLTRVRARAVLVRSRTMLINHVRGAAKSFGGLIRRCGASSFPKYAAIDLPKELVNAMSPLSERFCSRARTRKRASRG